MTDVNIVFVGSVRGCDCMCLYSMRVFVSAEREVWKVHNYLMELTFKLGNWFGR